MRLVDLDDVLKVLEKNRPVMYSFTLLDSYYLNGYVEAKMLVSEHPTIEAEPVKHGKWFLLDECSNAGVYCSVCHKKVYKENYANQKLKSNYCPNCGAKMDK